MDRAIDKGAQTSSSRCQKASTLLTTWVTDSMMCLCALYRVTGSSLCPSLFMKHHLIHIYLIYLVTFFHSSSCVVQEQKALSPFSSCLLCILVYILLNTESFLHSRQSTPNGYTAAVVPRVTLTFVGAARPSICSICEVAGSGILNTATRPQTTAAAAESTNCCM